jgi:hypothetical protein
MYIYEMTNLELTQKIYATILVEQNGYDEDVANKYASESEGEPLFDQINEIINNSLLDGSSDSCWNCKSEMAEQLEHENYTLNKELSALKLEFENYKKTIK